MELANELLDLVRKKHLVIRKLLQAAGISPRNFYCWVQGDQIPTPISEAKLKACLVYVRGF